MSAAAADRYALPAMPVAVIGGTGDEGFGLALRLAMGGEQVVIGSRAEERGQAAADKARDILGIGTGSGTRGEISGTSNQDAAGSCETVIVTVPFAGQAEIYRSIRDSIQKDAVVCDATSPLATAVGRPAWQVVTPWEGSAAEQAKAILRKETRIVAGFHTVSAESLQDIEHPMEGDVLLCGTDDEAKRAVGGLVEKIPHLRWVDTGPLSMARIVERLTAVLVSVNRNYGIKDAGFRLTGRDGWGLTPPAGR
jgi:8-hydroxy-5-deazaflavin:NADPH oxidoreductase